MSMTKTAIESQTTVEHMRGNHIGATRQKLNKSMSESQIDTNRIRQMYSRQANTMEHSMNQAAIEQNQHDDDAKNGCAIM